MEYAQKQVLFEEFLEQWAEKFEQVQSIIEKLAKIDNFSNRLKRLSDGYHVKGQSFYIVESKEPLNFNRSDCSESQLEWISLVAQFDNIIETRFFKKHWVPIQLDGFDYFIDLSTEGLSLIFVDFYCAEPYQWHEINILENLVDFKNIFNDNYWEIFFVRMGIRCAHKNDELEASVSK